MKYICKSAVLYDGEEVEPPEKGAFPVGMAERNRKVRTRIIWAVPEEDDDPESIPSFLRPEVGFDADET